MRKSTLTLWAACVALFAWLCWVPIAGGATVCVDDFAWLLMAHGRPTLSQALVASWSEYMFFRPIDVMANRLVDPRTLNLAPLLPIQMAGLLALTGGMCRLITVSSGKDYCAWACATLWLWLHPSTQLSIWSAGTSSQTWSSAAGIWLLCEVLGARQSGYGQLFASSRVLGLSVLGIIFKESFFGWATAAALVVLMRALSTLKNQDDQGQTDGLLRAVQTVALILIPAVMWVVARTTASTFGELVLTTNNSHYSLQAPTVIAKNVAIAILGMFVQGPVHWARLLPAPWLALPFVGAALSALFAGEGSRNAKMLAKTFLGISPLITCSAIGLIAVWPVLVIKHVSELYLMGPNALIAMLFGIGASAEIRRMLVRQRGGCNSTNRAAESFRPQWIALGVVMAIAVGGALSRSYHFGITWDYAKQMRNAALLAASEARRICVDDRFSEGPIHSKYIVPPTVAAALPSTFQARRLVDRNCPEVPFDCSRTEAPDEPAVLNPSLSTRLMW